ncbi:MAG: gliding motility-associated C-terminal domain-containing protein, partial [Bacteroidales bacterium]|nr:gliding motility-associated C-terminal domain-containing protein [Bacteroidales bacterium]
MPKDTGVCQGLSICLNPVADIPPQEVVWYWINDNGKTIQFTWPTLAYCQENTDESMNGRYYVEVANIAGSKRCTSVSDTTRLTVHPTPDLRIDGPTFICDGSTVTLTAVSRTEGTFRWHHNNETSAAISITEAGQYEVTRTSTYGCQNSASKTLEARPTPYFSLPPDTSICRGTSFMIYGPDGMEEYHWNDGSQDKDILAEKGGWYILTVYRNECPYSDSLYVQQSFCGQFHFPTAFTPNDNRVNDTWGAISAAKDEDMAEYDLMVFDRNGKKVFHGKRISDQWDGRYKGQLCPPGVYMY